MKKNKIALLALLGLGLFSAGTASAVVNTIYVVGSTAFRPVFYAAMKTGGGTNLVFDGGNPATVIGGTDANSSSQIVYSNMIASTPTVINCSWTGSEAGIAGITGNSLADVTIPAAFNGGTNTTQTPNLPGAPAYFLNPGNNYVGQTYTTTPDISLADTSVLSSQTAKTAVHDMGIVGVIPFLMAKNKNSSPGVNSTWTNLVNISYPQLFYLAKSGAQSGNFFTGKSGDSASVYLVGRNRGSGTRVNALLAPYVYPTQPHQYVIQNTVYEPASTAFAGAPLTLTLDPSPTAFNDSQVIETPNGDGFDSGSGVGKILHCDGTAATSSVLVGYISVADFGSYASGAVQLTVDGVAESDGAVCNGAYSFYGHEHLIEKNSPSSYAHSFATSLLTALPSACPSGATLTDANQSYAINPSLMVADKPTSSLGGAGDTGYPSQ